jgi:hypothetical protein
MLLFGTGFKGFDSQIYKRKRVSAFIIDETLIQTGKQYFWLWIYVLNQFHSSVLGISIQREEIFVDC